MINHYPFRALGKQQSLFPVGLGAMPLSLVGRPSEKEALQVILQFLEAGVNLIDTADVYGLDDSDRGHNERLIHKALTIYGERDRILIASKGGASRPEGGWALGGGHPKQLRQACESSLKNLGCESHDLYYLHGPDKQIPLEASLGELIQLQQEGKIRQLGISNVSLSELQQALRLVDLVAVQNRCNPFCKADFHNGLVQYCKEKKITYVAYCPLGGWADHVHLAQHAVLQELSSKYQAATYPLLLAWLLIKAEHLLPIPGMLAVEHVQSNLAALSLRLEEEDLQKLDNLPNAYQPTHVDP